MKIYLASDHRGFGLKNKTKQWLEEWGYDYEDLGALSYNQEDDYPDLISPAAEKVSHDPDNSKAIVFGRSGQGESIVANKYKNVRAATYYGGSYESIELSRKDNNANMLSIGAGLIDDKVAKEAVHVWLETQFSDEDRHKRRIKLIENIENKNG